MPEPKGGVCVACGDHFWSTHENACYCSEDCRNPKTPYYTDEQITLHHGDALEVATGLDTGAADCIVTSPPYFGLRDYGTEGQYGLEASPTEYVETMRALFAELRRVLADDGTLWLNIGDSYSSGTGNRNNGLNERWGNKPGQCKQEHDNQGRAATAGLTPKNLLGIPWRVAFALQDDGWILRNAIIWNKPNAMPESVTDRLSATYEHVFLFAKSRRYWFDLDPIRDEHGEKTGGTAGFYGDDRYSGGPAHKGLGKVRYHTLGRNPGDVWSIPTRPFPGAHFACFPVQLPQRCILAGCKPGGVVLDPFNGSGTTGLAAQRTGRKYVGIDINREYLELSLNTRLRNATLDFEEPA